jgi:hypothetical protein
VTLKELEARASEQLGVETKTVFVFAGGRWFRRVGPDEFVEVEDG